MLKSIRISSYKNIPKDTTLTLDFSSGLIYGVNGIGKTNLCEAVFMLQRLILGNLARIKKHDSCVSQGYSIEYAFIFSKAINYTCTFSADDVLLRESLHVGNQLLYEYSHTDSVFVHESFSRFDMRVPNTMHGSLQEWVMPILRLIFSSDQCPFYLSEMFDYILSMLLVDGSSLSADHITIRNDNELASIVQTMHKAGVEMELTLDRNGVGTPVLMMHTKSGWLPFSEAASTGEKAALSLFYKTTNARWFSLLCIDEFDAFFHYRLSKSVIGYLAEGVCRQFILTTHNTSLLNVVDYNMVYIMNRKGIYHLADLTSRKLSPSLNFERLYRAGEFDE